MSTGKSHDTKAAMPPLVYARDAAGQVRPMPRRFADSQAGLTAEMQTFVCTGGIQGGVQQADTGFGLKPWCKCCDLKDLPQMTGVAALPLPNRL